jgi:hypothetical protein
MVIDEQTCYGTDEVYATASINRSRLLRWANERYFVKSNTFRDF